MSSTEALQCHMPFVVSWFLMMAVFVKFVVIRIKKCVTLKCKNTQKSGRRVNIYAIYVLYCCAFIRRHMVFESYHLYGELTQR